MTRQSVGLDSLARPRKSFFWVHQAKEVQQETNSYQKYVVHDPKAPKPHHSGAFVFELGSGEVGSLTYNLSHLCSAVILRSGEREMRKHLHKISRLVPPLASAIVFVAPTDHTTAFTGTWRLNVAKSQFRPGPGPKRETVTAIPGGRTTLAGMDANGKPYKVSYPRSDGREVPLDGLENVTITETIAGNAMEQTMKVGGKVVSRNHGLLSKDGRTATFTVTAADEQGRPLQNVYVYEKQ
jgi:hypothetical protein